jgi:hypothetical protein
MDDLRNHLFETFERLKANNDPSASAEDRIDLPTAKQICEASEVIIQSVKVEVDFLHVLSRAENRDAVINAASNMLPKSHQKSIGQ